MSYKDIHKLLGFLQVHKIVFILVNLFVFVAF